MSSVPSNAPQPQPFSEYRLEGDFERHGGADLEYTTDGVGSVNLHGTYPSGFGGHFRVSSTSTGAILGAGVNYHLLPNRLVSPFATATVGAGGLGGAPGGGYLMMDTRLGADLVVGDTWKLKVGAFAGFRGATDRTMTGAYAGLAVGLTF